MAQITMKKKPEGIFCIYFYIDVNLSLKAITRKLQKWANNLLYYSANKIGNDGNSLKNNLDFNISMATYV
jgi:hypothetical protein